MPRKNTGASKSNAKKEITFEEIKSFEVASVREIKMQDGSSFISADVKINGVTIYGCKPVTYKDKESGEEKDFLAFPERKGKDGKYYKIAYVAMKQGDSQEICNAIYNKLDEA